MSHIKPHVGKNYFTAIALIFIHGKLIMSEARGRLHAPEHGLLGGPEGGLQNLFTVVSMLAS